MPVEKSHNSQQGNHRGPGTKRPQAEWFVMLRWLPRWELCDFLTGMDSCFYPMTHGNEGHWVLRNHAFPNTHFLHWLWHWSCDNMPNSNFDDEHDPYRARARCGPKRLIQQRQFCGDIWWMHNTGGVCVLGGVLFVPLLLLVCFHDQWWLGVIASHLNWWQNVMFATQSNDFDSKKKLIQPCKYVRYLYKKHIPLCSTLSPPPYESHSITQAPVMKDVTYLRILLILLLVCAVSRPAA